MIEEPPRARAGHEAQWIAACSLGEAMGIAVVALAYAATDRLTVQMGAGVILAAGAWEGLCLGGAQSLLLRRRGVPWRGWIIRSVAAAALGYALSLFAGAGTGAPAAAEPSPAMIALLGAGMGLFMGAAMGAIQSLGLCPPLRRRDWIVANALGWMPAMAVIMVVAAIVPAGLPLWTVAMSGAAAGAVGGAALGLVTSFALPPPPLAPRTAA